MSKLVIKDIETSSLFAEITAEEAADINGGYYSCGYTYTPEVVWNPNSQQYVNDLVLKYECDWI